MKNVTVYTSAACPRNPGPGGWAAVVLTPEGVFETAGYEERTTADRMEITATISALSVMTEHSDIRVIGAAYVVNAFTRGLTTKWQEAFWYENKKRVRNMEKWILLLKEVERHHSIHWRWLNVRSGGDVYSEHARSLAENASDGKVVQLRPATLGSRVAGPRSKAFSSIQF